MLVRMAVLSDVGGWVDLRARLWPAASPVEHRDEVTAMLAKPGDGAVAFVAVDGDKRICGFAEAALRHDYVNGCETSPVAFLEGVYVQSEQRGIGLGRRLVLAAQAWARERGCAEMASDALLENVESHAFHEALGFEETERVVYFRKSP